VSKVEAIEAYGPEDHGLDRKEDREDEQVMEPRPIHGVLDPSENLHRLFPFHFVNVFLTRLDTRRYQVHSAAYTAILATSSVS